MQIPIGTFSGYQYRPQSTAFKWVGRVETFVFGAYTVMPRMRTLAYGGKPVELGSRAFDLLVMLLRGRGRLIWKDEIMRAVWPTTTVVESNLRVQVAILRKVLGTEGRRIRNVPGRGYIFVMDDQPPKGGWAGQIASKLKDTAP